MNLPIRVEEEESGTGGRCTAPLDGIEGELVFTPPRTEPDQRRSHEGAGRHAGPAQPWRSSRASIADARAGGFKSVTLCLYALGQS
jgi:hypothetical protein